MKEKKERQKRFIIVSYKYYIVSDIADISYLPLQGLSGHVGTGS